MCKNMKYKYLLPDNLKQKAISFIEFGNGGAQATLLLKDGRVFRNALISNSTAIIALRGFNEIPFSVGDIKEIYQLPEDIYPKDRSGWEYWDVWE
jgi:hypothetical protein